MGERELIVYLKYRHLETKHLTLRDLIYRIANVRQHKETWGVIMNARSSKTLNINSINMNNTTRLIP